MCRAYFITLQPVGGYIFILIVHKLKKSAANGFNDAFWAPLPVPLKNGGPVRA